MASVKAFSVSRTAGGGTGPGSTVYSYSSGIAVQDGSLLSPGAGAEDNGAANADSFRTGLQPAYTKQMVAGPGDALQPTCINRPNTTGQVVSVGTLVAGDGNDAFVSDTFKASTTTIAADSTGAGLMLNVTTDADGEPTAATLVAGQTGHGYTDSEIVAIDGFPNSSITISID